jgi:hypothetical protein
MSLLLVVGCTAGERGTPSPELPSLRSPRSTTPDPRAPDPEPGPDAQALDAEQCRALIDEYLAARVRLNACRSDNDCAEIWPGLCPHGPYFIDREADPAPVWALARRIEAGCNTPECEPPRALRPGRCEEGVCVEGRTSPRSGELESCWDYELTYLESDGRARATAFERQTGPTPRFATGVRSKGAMSVTVEWGSCDGCELVISEHNSGMADLVEGQRTRSGTKETIELPVTPGPYFLLGRSQSGDQDFSLSLRVVDEAGALQQATLHGVAWQRVCEG